MEQLEVLDWRRAVHRIYAEVRSADSPHRAWVHWRTQRDRLFREHPASPIAPERRPGYLGVPLFAYDPRLRFLVERQPIVNGSIVETDLGQDGIIRLRPLFRTCGLSAALGIELTAYWIEAYGGGVFLPFLDRTAGQDSYAAGRYLLDTIKGADLGEIDGRTVLDFNFAYHPSCYYDPRWICPLPPRTNTLTVAVRAGERLALDAGAFQHADVVR